MMEEGISSRSSYTKLKLKKLQLKMIIKIFFVTILTLLTLATFAVMSSNIEQVKAQTNVNPECGIVDQNPSGECTVAVDYDGNCNSSDPNCNVNVNVNNIGPQTFNPNGNNQLKLNYLLETGIECSNVKSSWGKTACLTASQNEYRSDVDINTDNLFTKFDNEFDFQGSQQVINTDGQNNFAATNKMDQDVALTTRGTTSVIDTDADGTDVLLQYNQVIDHPDDSANTNEGRQYVSLDAQSGGDIDTTDYSQWGLSLDQRLIDNDDDNTLGAPTQNAINKAHQVVGVDSDNNAYVEFDLDNRISQIVEDCSFSTGTSTCQNLAGNPATTNQFGQYTQLRADGTNTIIDLDDLEQLLTQRIDDFRDSNGKTATNQLANPQLFEAVATSGGEIDMDISDVTAQTQSLSQSITDSDENSDNVAQQRISVGTNTIPVQGLAEVDVDQELEQSITGATSGPTSNLGTMTLTLLSKEGPSQLFVENFDQYLRQTAACSGCHNNGQVHAIFEVEDAATFTLKDGSSQGLTQTVTQDGASNNNIIYSQIYVSGAGTTANIGLYFQISNINGANNGVASFTGTYTGGGTYNQNCIITSVGAYTQDSPGICY